MRRLKHISTLICLALVSSIVRGQGAPSKVDTASFHAGPEVGTFPKKPDEVLYNFKVGGFYRFFGTFTHHKEDYLIHQGSNATVLQKNLFIGDDSQLPNLTLNFSGRPNKKTSWGFDLFAFQFLDGNLGTTYGYGQVSNQDRPTVWNPLDGSRLATNLNLQLGINMYGDFKTDIGVIGVKTGGIHWVSISDLTLRAFTGYNRYSLFERNPWDPISGKALDRYSLYHTKGNINQDTRWGERPFVGTIIEASKLPGNLSAKLLYGKTDINGGFLTIPNLSTGGQIKKNYSKGFIAINTFNNRTFFDSTANESVGFNLATAEIKHLTKVGVQFSGEVGAGRYYSPQHAGDWGEAITFKVLFTKKLLKLPTELHFYRVSDRVINNNSVFFNAAIVEANPNQVPAGQAGSTSLLAPFASAVVPIGMFTNNRTGFNINTEWAGENLKFSASNGVSSELRAVSNLISFGHPVNQLTRSRIWRWNFPTNVGPYNRYNVIFRDVYELMQITDTVVPKKFNVMEFQVKYHDKILHRDLYVIMLNRYSSVQDFISPFTVFTEKAYLRHYSNEVETYYALAPKLVVVGYLGYERILANYQTEVDVVTERPRNQTGTGIGIGFDYDIARNTAFYLRHRWFRFEDASFAQDYMRGTETVFELKFSF